MIKSEFQAEITMEVHAGIGTHVLRITHNGYQWRGFHLNLDEMKIIKGLLAKK